MILWLCIHQLFSVNFPVIPQGNNSIVEYNLRESARKKFKSPANADPASSACRQAPPLSPRTDTTSDTANSRQQILRPSEPHQVHHRGHRAPPRTHLQLQEPTQFSGHDVYVFYCACADADAALSTTSSPRPLLLLASVYAVCAVPRADRPNITPQKYIPGGSRDRYS